MKKSSNYKGIIITYGGIVDPKKDRENAMLVLIAKKDDRQVGTEKVIAKNQSIFFSHEDVDEVIIKEYQ